MQATELMRTSFLSVSVDDPLSKALGRLQAGKHHTAIVLDTRDRYVGLLDKEACLRSRGDISSMKVRRAVRKTSRVDESMTIERIAKLLLASDVHVLPVLDKYKRVAGIVGARDVMVALSDKLRGLKVEDVATRYPVVLTPQDNVAKAIEILRRQHISRLPVVDDKRKLVGIITLFDVLKMHSQNPEAAPKRSGGDKKDRTSGSKEHLGAGTMQVGDIMVRVPQTIAPSAAMPTAVRKMADANCSDLIVVDDGAPVGMLTSKDILKRITQ